MPARIPYLVLAFAALLPPAVLAAESPFGSAKPYDECLALIETEPDDAFENALIWRDHGGGSPAEHCAALALLELGQTEDAAMRLEDLAQRNDSGTAQDRAELLSQSGDAWLSVRRADRAETVFSAALKLTPRDGRLWTGRARARAMREDWRGAEDDLSAALTFEADDPEIYVLRYAARSRQDKLALARLDLEAALRIDPASPNALAERGMLKFADGDRNGARADWIKVLQTAPDSAAADTARRGIERMEVRIEP